AALDAARRSGEVVHEHEMTEVAIEEAIAAERESCAKISEDYSDSIGGAIAAAIRDRNTGETP
ncbi:MAG: hypothetical protein ABL893_04620, partial [Hyphomicrobium sp.]